MQHPAFPFPVGQAAAVMDQAVDSIDSIPASFLPQWCKILYEAERWNSLFDIANSMRERSPGAAGVLRRFQANFYLGMSDFHRGNYAASSAPLGSFSSSSARHGCWSGSS